MIRSGWGRDGIGTKSAKMKMTPTCCAWAGNNKSVANQMQSKTHEKKLTTLKQRTKKQNTRTRNEKKKSHKEKIKQKHTLTETHSQTKACDRQ